MKTILYIPQFNLLNEETNKFILDNIQTKLFKDLFTKIQETYKDEFKIITLFPITNDIDDIDFFMDFLDKMFQISQNFGFIPYVFPKKLEQQQYNFDFIFYQDLINNIKPSIILNNIDTLTKNFSILSQTNDMNDVKIITISYENGDYLSQTNSFILSDKFYFFTKEQKKSFIKSTNLIKESIEKSEIFTIETLINELGELI